MTSRRLVPAPLLAALGILLSATAHAGPPSAANSFVDACLRVCPAGDMNFHVLVRDASNNPVAGSTVMINVSCMPETSTICPPPVPPATDPYTFVPPSSILMLTNAAGVADFPIRAGGVCGGPVNIYADGVLLATRTGVVSPDQDGSFVVDTTDVAILASKLGTSDPTGDLDCSGIVDFGDPNLLVAHDGHTCLAVVPNRPKSWGSVKVIYR
jgi:hypothetical protein